MRLDPEREEAYRRSCLEIEPLAIHEEYVRVPADLGYWNERYAAAVDHYLMCKLRREQVYAQRIEVLRKSLEASSVDRRGKGKAAEIAVQSDRYYLVAAVAETHALSEKTRIWGILDAIRAKRDMLVSLGAHLRSEMLAGVGTGDET